MIQKRSCKKCTFWKAAEDVKVTGRGECRRTSPKPRVEVCSDDGPDRWSYNIWPETDETDWCGEYEYDGTRS